MKITKILRYIFAGQLLVAAIVALLGETGLLHAGALSDSDERIYILSIVGVALAIICIPLALKLLHMKRVRTHLLGVSNELQETESGNGEVNSVEQRYKMWSEIRLCMLWLALMYNLIMYYLLDFNTTCGYLALMTVVAYIFVWPSDERMATECEDDVNAKPRI